MSLPDGRPPKYTPERLAAILADIKDRIPYELAAESNGIRERTLYRWINQGWDELEADLETPLASFCQDLKKVEKERIKEHYKKLENNAERWQSDAWILERRWHKYFSPNVQIKEMDERLKNIEQNLVQKEL